MVYMAYSWGEFHLRMVWPLEAHCICSAVVAHREGQLTWFCDVAIAKLDQVGWSSCKFKMINK